MTSNHLRLVRTIGLHAFSGFLLATSTPQVSADSFDVYCVPSTDGISTCSGWKDGGTLTCVSSTGGVASCNSSSGQKFTCTQDGGGVTTCQDPQTTNQSNLNDDCTYIGNGSFSCSNQPIKSADLIPSQITNENPINIPSNDLKLSIPSLIPWLMHKAFGGKTGILN